MNDRRNRPRRNGFISVLNGLLTLLVVGMVVAGGIVLYGASQFYAAGPVPEERSFLVERGNSLGEVAKRLEDQGLIANRYIFQAGSLALRKQSAIKAGEYRLAAGSSMADVLREITEGRAIQYGVTIPEGFTSWQAMVRLNEETDLVGEVTTLPPEGSILPDTYSFERGATRQSVLDRMQAAMTEAVAEIWAARDPDLPIDTPEDLVTLASVIEKETGIASEHPQVAAVFVNRLKRGMRLQSDPTIIYGITKGQAPLGRGLRRSEIEAKTPYNTYQVDGLPAGPIANPGIESLRAAANPDGTKYLYFVAKTASASDGHLFAETYAAHQRNVATYRAAVREALALQEAQEAEAARETLAEEQAVQGGDTTRAP
jgi:UPF0755 protein